MRRFLYILLFCGVSFGFAQKIDDTKARDEAAKGDDTTKAFGWNLASATGLNLSQVAYENWASGGQNSLAWGLWFNGGAVHRAERTRWANSLKLAYGQTKLQGQTQRKTDDEIYFETLLIYLVGSTVNPYASATLRTQFAPGFEYPDEFTQKQISAFFDPAYLTQSVGVGYSPSSLLTIRAGVGAREVITGNFNKYADDPETPEIEKTRVQGGLEGIADFRWPFAENMVFLSRLETFFAFNDFAHGYARWDNTIAMKVNALVTANINVQLISDPLIQARTQLKEAVSVGLSYTLL